MFNRLCSSKDVINIIRMKSNTEKINSTFTKNTFLYFKNAEKNQNNKDWFLKNKDVYLDHVKSPFENLLVDINKKIQKDIPDLRIDSKLITRPTRPSNKASEGLVKNMSYATITEKRTSLFEWNPGIHIQFGHDLEENFIGCGLYMVSGRQISLLRNAIANDFETISKILNSKKLKNVWGSLLGDMYVRPPKGFRTDEPYSKLLMHKQFYLHRQYKISEINSKSFSTLVINDLKLILPFFEWLRHQVGTYSRKPSVSF